MKEFAVIGCGRFGSSVATTLYSLGHEVVAIDIDPERVQDISDEVSYGVVADVTDEHAVKDLGLSNFDIVVVSIGSNYQASIMATLLAKEYGVKTVFAKALDELHGKVLLKTGADKIIYPERDMGVRVAHSLVSSSILDFIKLSPDYSVLEMNVLDEWIGKSLGDLDLSQKYGVNVIAIRTEGDINVSPNGSDIANKGDVLVIIGGTDNLKVIEDLVNE